MVVTFTMAIPQDQALNPPGFGVTAAREDIDTGHADSRDRDKDKTRQVLQAKKAWDVVRGIMGSIPMTLFMMWMIGNNVQIFSIAVTGMAIFNAIRSMTTVNAAFTKFESAEVNLLPQKLAFILMQGVLLGLGLWKCQSMGLLPTTTSDWLSFLPQKEALELSVPGVIL